MRDDQLAAKPFHLDATAIGWVRTTLAQLTPDDKLRQMFNLWVQGNDPAEMARLAAFRPGSITRIRGADREEEARILAAFNDAAPVPLLVSADLEGGRGSAAGQTETPNPLALAAINDVAMTEAISRVMAEEAHALGTNWSFTPLLDINAAFRSAIVATRGFGSDIEAIERHALAQLRTFQQNGVAATVKHWPGEGHDDRDQHLVTTVNPLTMAEWEAQHGRLYRAAIEAGVMSVMSAHIALPAYVRAHDPDAGVEMFRPASISRLLNETLLREELGFNGLIVSDATGMGGLTAWSSRSDHLPEIVAAGCDVILFAENHEADLRYLADALADGRLSWERVDEAVTRQLAMKAALGLHKSPAAGLQPDRAANQRLADAAFARAPTLVKDTQALLPLDPQKHKRVLVFSTGIVVPYLPHPLPFALPDLLRERGFEVAIYEAGQPIDTAGYDLVLYLMGEETLLTRGRIFLDWLKLTGHFSPAMKRVWNDVPTMMISFGYPYYLYDAPRMPTYINAYTSTRGMQRAVVEALLGNVPWNTYSPVDPFAGDEQARY